MSGFTKGAIDQAKNYANQRMILLFGPKDVENITLKKGQFEVLLNEKYKQLVTRQAVIVDRV